VSVRKYGGPKLAAGKSRSRFSTEEKFTVGVLAVWFVGLLFTLAFWAVVVWGIIELVQWVTSK
jgi:hypothetical protein